jgi:hypothetical protein
MLEIDFHFECLFICFIFSFLHHENERKKIDNLKAENFPRRGKSCLNFSHVSVFSEEAAQKASAACEPRRCVRAKHRADFPLGDEGGSFLSLLLRSRILYTVFTYTVCFVVFKDEDIPLLPIASHRLDDMMKVQRNFRLSCGMERWGRVMGKLFLRLRRRKLMIYWPKDQTNLLMTQEGRRTGGRRHHQSRNSIQFLR